MATNTELAQLVLDLLIECVRDGRNSESPPDSVPDHIAAAIANGLQREGFASELIRRASDEGVELDARQICEVHVAGLQSRRLK